MLEVNRSMGTSTKANSRTLARISAGQLKLFWIELANLSEDPRATDHFDARFRRFLPWAGLEKISLPVNAIDDTLISETDSGEGSSNRQTINDVYDPLIALRNEVRAIWREDDPETKEWRIFCLRGDPTMTLSFLATLDPHMMPKLFQKAVLHLFKSAGKLRCCHNPDCPAQYFVACRRSQKYCSADCTLPTQRKQKRRWWRKNGHEWRENRIQRAAHKTKRPTRGRKDV
jgi:hypothetical protein